MRKLLLASVAAMGTTMGLVGIGHAQTTTDVSGTTVSPTDGLGATGGGASGTDGQAFPNPGTVTVRLNGRFRAYGGYYDAQQYNNAGFKDQTYGLQDYARLYPGVDGVAANGLKYGAALEIRQDSGTGSTTGIQAGGGVNPSISAVDSRRGELYFRREWGYVGTNDFGVLRVGSTDGPTSLYATGTFENFNDGGWNGDVGGMLPGNQQIAWPFDDVGNEYTTTKLIYLSPQIYGFDGGVSWAPGTGNVSDGGGGNAIITTGTDLLSSAPNGEVARPTNIGEALIRYRGTFGAFGIAATAAYVGSGHVNYSGVPGATQLYDGFSIGDFGAVLTYGGLQVGGHFERGRFQPGFTLAPKGGPDAVDFMYGASYTIGPLVVGGSWLDTTSAGNVTAYNATGSQQRQFGAAAGATYSVAPGLAIFVSYLWDQIKQSDFDRVTNTNDRFNNKTRGQVLTLGTSFAW